MLTKLEIGIANKQSEEVDLREIERIVRQALQLEGVEEGEVSILLADDELIRELNREYRQVDEATDVLAFAFREGEQATGPCLGEIVVSTETCRQQAIQLGHSFEKELAVLLIHGTLHLLSYDHLEEDEARIMRQKEEEILRAIEGNKTS
ncbi:MAG: rRNA maturation RNase YbeY [bacterium]|nr:rRNA maturation RNase YbeY [bacterium]